MVLATALTAVKERHTNLVAICREKSNAPGSDSVESVDVAAEQLRTASEALCQAARLLYILMMGGAPSDAELTSCVRDLEKAAASYDSWARVVLACCLPAARRAIGPPCCQVLQCVCTFLTRAQSGPLQASDVGPIQEATASLASLETSPKACCRRLLQESGRLVADALRELRESIAEAQAEARGDGAQVGDDDDDDDDDDDEPALLARVAISAPLTRLLECVDGSIRLAEERGVERAEADVTLTMLITCGAASSEQVDTLVCAADDDDVDALREHASSLARLIKKINEVLSKRCGLDDDAARAKLDADAAAALDELRACTLPPP